MVLDVGLQGNFLNHDTLEEKYDLETYKFVAEQEMLEQKCNFQNTLKSLSLRTGVTKPDEVMTQKVNDLLIIFCGKLRRLQKFEYHITPYSQDLMFQSLSILGINRRLLYLLFFNCQF